MCDLIIKNADIIDGLGTPAFKGGLAVENGRIVAVGDDLGTAKKTLDAEGLTCLLYTSPSPRDRG